MAYIELNETVAEATKRRTRQVIGNTVRGCQSAVTQLKSLMEDRGGRAAFIAEIGDDAASVQSAVAAMKTYIETISDQVGEEL